MVCAEVLNVTSVDPDRRLTPPIELTRGSTAASANGAVVPVVVAGKFAVVDRTEIVPNTNRALAVPFATVAV